MPDIGRVERSILGFDGARYVLSCDGRSSVQVVMRWISPGLILMLTVVVSVVGACDFGMEPLPCDCPELENAVMEVDWAPSLAIRSTESGRDGSLEVVVTYDGEGHDGDALESRVVQAMDLSGYEVSELSGGGMQGRYQDLTVWVSQSSELNSDTRDLRIAVKFDGADGPEVREQLAPLRSQLDAG
jgi:hypothetical protein